MKYLYLARKRGAQVAVVNPLREPGLERYWVPSHVENAMFGTRMADEFFAVHTGGDVAFLNGVLKALLATGGVDRDFRRPSTRRASTGRSMRLDAQSTGHLERVSGATRADMERFARLYADAGRAILVWSMGITQHEHGADNVAAIVNLALARGKVGRPGAGSCRSAGTPACRGRGDGGVRDDAAGRCPRRADTAAALEREVRASPFPSRPAWPRRMVDAAGRGELDVLYSSGGNFLDVLPDPAHVEACARARLRCAFTRTSCCRARCWSSPATRSCCCRPHALRAARRRHRDHDRAPHRLQSGDRRGRGSGRRAPSGRSSSTWRARVQPEARRPHSLRGRAGDARRDRARGPVYAGIETLPRHRRPGAVRRRAPVRGRRIPDRRREGALRGPRCPTGRRVDPPRPLPAPHPAGQAVQLDAVRGAGSRSPAHGRDALLMSAADADRSASPTARRCSCARSTASCAPRPPGGAPARQRAGVLPRGQRAHRSAGATPLGGSRLQRPRRAGGAVTPDDSRLFDRAAAAQAAASGRSHRPNSAAAPRVPVSTRSISSPTRRSSRYSILPALRS